MEGGWKEEVQNHSRTMSRIHCSSIFLEEMTELSCVCEVGTAGLVGPGLPAPSPLCVACCVCRGYWQLLHLKKTLAKARLLGPGALESLGQVGSHLDSGRDSCTSG